MRSQYGAKFINGKISMIGFPQYPDKLLAYLLIGLGNTDMFNASHFTDQLRDTLICFAARSGPLYGYDFALLKGAYGFALIHVTAASGGAPIVPLHLVASEGS